MASVKIATAAAGIYILAYVIWLHVFRTNDWMVNLGGNLFEAFAPLIAAIWLYRKYSSEDTNYRKFWLYLCVANICYAVAMLCWMYYEIYLRVEPPFPGIPDVFWLIMSGFYLTAFTYLAFAVGKASQVIQLVIDTLIVMVVATSISWEFIIKPILASAVEHSFFYKLVYVGYPVSDLAVLFALLSTFNSSHVRISARAMALLFFGILSFLIADSLYLFLVSHDQYSSGMMMNVLWALGTLMIGLSAYYHQGDIVIKEQRSNIIEDQNETRKVVVKYFFSLRLWLPYLSVVVLFIIMANKGQELDGFGIGLVVSVFLIVFRQIFTLIENDVLLKKSASLNSELELIVEKRTKQLFEKNQELEASIRKAEFLAYHDTLTGLPNRRYFENYLHSVLIEAEGKQSKAAVLFLDLDRFKIINDTFSHSIGDLLLKQVAARLEQCVNNKGLICRQGGDEFLVLLPNGSQVQAGEMAQKILECLSEVFKVEEHELFITASVGVTIYPDHGERLEELIKRADAAMYAVKDNGKNSYRVFTPYMDEISQKKLDFENDLRKALDRNEFILHYQPRREVNTNKITGVEALIRWKHPETGLLFPEAFMPIAEEAGLIHSIGKWMLQTACRQIKSWQEKGFWELCVSVNVSSGELKHADFYQQVSEALEITGLDPIYLELEINESAAGRMHEASFVLKRLRKLGVKISLGEFGAEFASLNQIRYLPLDIIKIDKSLVAGMGLNERDRTIMTAALDLAKSLGLSIVAEGVETEAQLTILQKSGCDQVQGPLIAPPLSEQVLELKIQEKTLYM